MAGGSAEGPILQIRTDSRAIEQSSNLLATLAGDFQRMATQDRKPCVTATPIPKRSRTMQNRARSQQAYAAAALVRGSSETRPNRRGGPSGHSSTCARRSRVSQTTAMADDKSRALSHADTPRAGSVHSAFVQLVARTRLCKTSESDSRIGALPRTPANREFLVPSAYFLLT